MKKTFGKMGQWTGEKFGVAHATQLDESFIELEKKTDEIDNLCKNLVTTTEAYLQPNAGTRAKLKQLSTGKNEKRFQQPEEEFGETMIKSATEISASPYGKALNIVGEAEIRVGEARHAMDAEVMQAFVKPVGDFHCREVKEVQKCRQKLDSRRLTYDSARRAYEKKEKDQKSEEDFKQEEKRFEEIKELTFDSMLRLIENDAEQCGQLLAFVEAQLAFHRAAAGIIAPILTEIDSCTQEAESLPLRRKKSHPDLDLVDVDENTSDVEGCNEMEETEATRLSQEKECYVIALYDFEPQNEEEMAFTEGDRILLLSTIDENWMEGLLGDFIGIFPSSYVEYETKQD